MQITATLGPRLTLKRPAPPRVGEEVETELADTAVEVENGAPILSDSLVSVKTLDTHPVSGQPASRKREDVCSQTQTLMS